MADKKTDADTVQEIESIVDDMKKGPEISDDVGPANSDITTGVKDGEINSLAKVLRESIPQNYHQKIQELEKDQETNIRVHNDKVAVYEVSMHALDNIDGTNGYYDIITGSEESREYGLSDSVEFTKQGLAIVDRFPVVLNRLPTDEWHCEYVVVSLEDWEKSRVKQVANSLMSSEEEFAGLMRKAGGSV